jgi:hypothetical protein
VGGVSTASTASTSSDSFLVVLDMMKVVINVIVNV